MNIQRFLEHHGVTENPFLAEEARHDPVLMRMSAAEISHPDFAKILGQFDRPSAAVVLGEKGSGKTAIRLMIERVIAEHNERQSDRRVLLVPYDDLNGVLDRVVKRRQEAMGRRGRTLEPEKLLSDFRLEDHQDAILSLAVTRLVDGLLKQPSEGAVLASDTTIKRLRKEPRRVRADVAVLAALYDDPSNGRPVERWKRLCTKLRLSRRVAAGAIGAGAVMALLAGAVLGAAGWWRADQLQTELGWAEAGQGALAAAGLLAAATVLLGVIWARMELGRRWLCRRICSNMPAVNRTSAQLQQTLGQMRDGDIADHPWPKAEDGAAGRDSRYELTARLLRVLKTIGYNGVIVLVDRVDEPTLISGRTDRMRAIVWPMFDHKFLQQEGVGMKLLLPIELRPMLLRESPEFFQSARLDKQNLIDRLAWSGATLYDLCSRRLNLCRKSTGAPITLKNLFDEDVSREMVIDALDQMHQPRDAFKFLYAVLQTHCQVTAEDEGGYRIARLTLEAVRREQSRRVQELAQGLTPA